MSAAVWSFLGAVIVGLLSLGGVIYSAHKTGEITDTKLQVGLAEMRKDIQALRDETQKHNGLIERTYKLEADVGRLQDEDHRQNRRIEELERRTEI